jgi:RNA polymerase sigma factor (TIGR02999 family)
MGEVTELLQRVAAQDAAAREPLYRTLYPELMQLARGHLARAGTTSLDVSGLIHDAYLRLERSGSLPHQNRRVFLAYASKVMRSVILDYVRDSARLKRGGAERALTLDTAIAERLFADHLPAEIEEAMAALEETDARCCSVVEMRYFGGLSEEEVADALEVSLPTVKRDWRRARAFLFDYLGAHG